MNTTIRWIPLLPVLIPAAGVIAVLLLDALLPRRGQVHWIVAALALAATVVSCVPGLREASGQPLRSFCSTSGCAYVVDRPTATLQVTAAVASLAVVLLAMPISWPKPRVAILAAAVLATTAGTNGVVAARDLAAWLVLLELTTVPTIALVALRGRQRAISGALALLTTSLVSFAITAMGAALWFAATGSARLDGNAVLHAAADRDQRMMLALAVVFMVAGLGFKLSTVPFHAWTPEAFDGASAPIGMLLATTSKVAALGALLAMIRGVTVLGHGALVAVGVLALASMTIGNLMALRERSVWRFLAWSTVSQGGWVLMPLATVAPSAIRAASGYLALYILATVVAFAAVTSLAHAEGRDTVTDLSAYTGMLRRHPLSGTALALALLSLAGLPPGIAGLIAKVYALDPVASAGTWWLAVLAAVNAMIGVAVYLRWLMPLWRTSQVSDADRSHPIHRAVVVLGLLGLVVVSIAPNLLIRLLGA